MKLQRGFMRLQWKAMQAQVAEMGKQTGILTTSVEAAKATAEAARDSVEIVISKERARLTVEPGQLVFPTGDELVLFSIAYKVKLKGTTDASIVRSEATVLLSDSESPPAKDDGIVLGITIPQWFAKEHSIADHYHPVWKKGEKLAVTAEDVAGLKDGTKFIHFWGFIDYRDIFGRPHTSKFRYLWKLNEFSFGRVHRSGSWRKHGPDEDNEDR